jgi:tetratricopeptide (TPR) repeat protein
VVVRLFATAALGLLCLTAADPLRETFEAAARALSQGDLDGAQRGFEQVVKTAPNHVPALANLGVVYSRQGRSADAIAVYRKALQLAPDEPGLLLNLGLAHLKIEEPGKAKPLFARVAALQPSHSQARELLASTQVLTGEAQTAVGTLEPLRRSEPRNSGVLYFLGIAYLKLGDREKAREALDSMFAAVSEARANYLQGKAYYESELYEEAVTALEKARVLDSSIPDVHLELGKTYVSLRRAKEAEAALRETLRRRASDAEAAYFLGALLTQDGRTAEGVRLLETAQTARPDFWGTYYYLGKSRLQEGDAKGAVKLLRAAAERKPEEPAVYYQLGRALKTLGLAEEARVAMERVTELKKNELNRSREALVSR